MGEDPGRRQHEIASLRRGIEQGMTLIDTATMYGDGLAEELVGEAIAPVRDSIFLVDKVLPYEASYEGVISSCEGSLSRLGTDFIDLLLLHWPGSHPAEETVRGFENLRDRGLIGAWGVSNFDPDNVRSLPEPPLVNQVLYNPSRRGMEYDLLPLHMQSTPPVTTMAYSPIEQGRLLASQELHEVAENLGASVAQVLIAWAIRDGRTIAIPKASSIQHVDENATPLALSSRHLDLIDRAFPPPVCETPLEML